MQMSEQKATGALTSVGSSVGTKFAEQVTAVVMDKVRHPGKYGDKALARFAALNEIYEKFYTKAPMEWELSEANQPLCRFLSGTWEQYFEEQLKGEATVLRGDVGTVLLVISRFLDNRRAAAGIEGLASGFLPGFVHDVYRGDVEEQFFSELADFALRELDCNVNDSLVEVISTRIEYLKDVMNNTAIFPKKLVNDKAISFGVISEIREILQKIQQKVKTVHNGKFLLDKFGHISTTGELLLKNFLTAFSYLSDDFEKVTEFNSVSLSSVMKGKKNALYRVISAIFRQCVY